MINGIFKSSVSYAPQAQSRNVRAEDNKEVKQAQKNEQTSKTENETDKYEKPLSNYERDKKISYMLDQAERQTKNFEKLVSSIFSKQANKVGLINMAESNNLKAFYQNLTVDAQTVAKAKEAVSEDGYYGVNQTSDRILSFAKAVAGDNPKKIQEMRDAVEKGFKQAERMWGDELPEISQKTYDKVMETFDKWQGKDVPEKEPKQ
nr:hypothetical protein [uncultured Tyzzerella sp.]